MNVDFLRRRPRSHGDGERGCGFVPAYNPCESHSTKAPIRPSCRQISRLASLFMGRVLRIARTHVSKIFVSNLIDCRPSVPPRLIRFCRNRACFLLQRSWQRNDLRPSHEALWKHREGELRRPLDPMPRQRPRTIRARQGDRSLAQCGARARHDAIGRHSRLPRLA